MAFNDNDEDDQQKKKQPAQQPSPQAQGQGTPGALAGGGQGQQAYPFQRTFQPPPGGATPGQQTPMPWSGGAPGYAGGGATPWAQQLTAAPQAGQQAAMPGGMPNWQALAQRFGGGQQLGNASPAFQRPQFGGFGGQGMAGGQQNPWLQQLMQGAAQRIAAARAQGGAPQQQMPQQQMPQQQGFAMPQWGGGMPGRQY